MHDGALRGRKDDAAAHPGRAGEGGLRKEIFVSPSLQMVTFTITEKGYALQKADGTRFPFVESDIQNGPDKAVGAMAQNKEVAFSVCFEGIYGHGIGENLGWVLDPQNATLRTKLREVFADWYDDANNEQDENCVILAIRITSATIFRDHGALRYNLDFVNKTEVE